MLFDHLGHGYQLHTINNLYRACINPSFALSDPSCRSRDAIVAQYHSSSGLTSMSSWMLAIRSLTGVLFEANADDEACNEIEISSDQFGKETKSSRFLFKA